MQSTAPLEQRIEAARVALRDAGEFSTAVDLFEQTLVHEEDFKEVSVQARNEVIEQAVAQGVGAILETDDPVVLLLFQVPGRGMWHGFALCGDIVGLFFGFDQTSQLCLCMTTGGRSHYLRISWKETPMPKVRRTRARHLSLA